MDTLKSALAQLNPPVEHQLEFRDRIMHLELRDPSVPAQVERVLKPWEYQSADLLYVIILHAINELRGKGSNAPLRTFRINHEHRIDWSEC
ncbi:hypothetical protein [Pseudomonas typographi]|uniref:Uncharacterized protein n=1 Tax=Pseudomonas typographi TaxID=2715964 RepID=A0ABR7Z7J2_9PSED|nr:hypothetical protein [Pseudomonas typographi]MBD1554632.1 hypothetical protein [Pseudomonas typographi]MBD1587163.1 hypothetical protein [Pseudomonas typographi]MBD1601387.1 hypothetical protein [Pseudomonas typographi]